MMTQRQYSILYWVTLVMGLVATTLGRDMVGAIMYLISCIFMVAGDFALRWEKTNGECEEG